MSVRTSTKYTVYQDTEQWLPFLHWFWIRPGETGLGHGPYPARWLAGVSAWMHTFDASAWMREHPHVVITAKANIQEYNQIDVTVSHPETYLPDQTGTGWGFDEAVARAVGEAR